MNLKNRVLTLKNELCIIKISFKTPPNIGTGILRVFISIKGSKQQRAILTLKRVKMNLEQKVGLDLILRCYKGVIAKNWASYRLLNL